MFDVSNKVVVRGVRTTRRAQRKRPGERPGLSVIPIHVVGNPILNARSYVAEKRAQAASEGMEDGDQLKTENAGYDAILQRRNPTPVPS